MCASERLGSVTLNGRSILLFECYGNCRAHYDHVLGYRARADINDGAPGAHAAQPDVLPDPAIFSTIRFGVPILENSRSFQFFSSHVIDPAYKSPSPEVLSYGENYLVAPFFKMEIDSVILNIHDSKESRIAE